MNTNIKTREYTTVSEVSGPLMVVEGVEGVGYNEIVDIETPTGEKRSGQVLEVTKDVAVIQVFEGTNDLNTKDTKTRFTGQTAKIGVSRDMMGRIFNGIGKPIDGGPEIIPDEELDINGAPMNPASREFPEEFIQTGISTIDGMNTLVRGQKLPIFSGSGLPHNDLAVQIARQAKVLGADDEFAVIFAAMGITNEEANFFMRDFERTGALEKLTVFMNLADDPAIERILTPKMALTTAEYYAFTLGMQVLVILTDMTNYCEALREISAAREEVPGRRGYPGYMYTDLAGIYERAGRIDGKEGSITQMPILVMPQDDITHPIPDLTGYITEGQYYLKGGRIEPFGSLSRLKQNVNGSTRSDHRALMDGMIRLYSNYKDTLEKKSMGFNMSKWDEKLLVYGKMFEDGMMDLSKNISLEDALDLGWKILADCFEPEETGLKSSLIDEYWPKK